MKKAIDLLGSEKLLTAAFIFFVAVYIVFDIKGMYNTPIEIANNDNYIGLFNNFLNAGYYDSIAKGTSILYNVFLYGIYFLTRDVDVSFFLLNAMSELTILLFGCFFCYKVFGKKNKYFYIVVSWYVLQVLSMRSSLRASNDTFLGVFVMLLLYLLIVKLYDRRREVLTFSLLGLLLSITMAIRVTAILLLPLIIIALAYWFKNTEMAVVYRLKLLVIFAFVTAFVTLCFHYPSLVEHQKLSYESKEPNMPVNWVQRNYLGLKKIEDGTEKMHRDAIWNNTKFDEVLTYTQKNGANSLPKTLPEVIVKNPLMLFKIAIYNGVFTVLNYFRFWGFLFLLPIFGLCSRSIMSREKLPTTLFVVYLAIISTVCFSFIELRWVYGYEVLIPVGILAYLSKPVYFASVPKKNAIFSLSLMLVSLFHLKSIFF